VLNHPAALAIFVVPVLVPFVLLGIMYRSMFQQGERFALYKDQIEILQSEVRFGERESGPTVSVIGKLKNNSDVDWTDIRIEVQFFDGEGNLIDAKHHCEFSMILAAGQTAGFKVPSVREFPQQQYASHKVTITHAKDRTARF
jgi:hypothetical protein